MPNHVENWLTIEGQQDKVEEVVDFLRGTWADGSDCALSFDRVIPYPEHFKSLDTVAEAWDKEQKDKDSKTVNWTERPKDGFNSGGMEWCVENWGTKWGAYKIRGPIIFDPKYENKSFYRADYLFETAWNQPTLVIKALAVRFPGVTITCSSMEQGSGFFKEFTSISSEFMEEESPKHKVFKCDYEGSRGG